MTLENIVAWLKALDPELSDCIGSVNIENIPSLLLPNTSVNNWSPISAIFCGFSSTISIAFFSPLFKVLVEKYMYGI